MKHSTKEFKKSHSALLASTGLASAAMLMSGAHPVMADGLYAGVSIGTVSGESPSAGWGSDYTLSGTAKGIFVGAHFMDVGGASLSGELAFTGQTDIDVTWPSEDGNTAYSVNWTGDAKLRLGTDIGKSFGLEAGKLTAYGFVGGTTGMAMEAEGGSYGFSGTNFGAGIETELSNKMFVGLEAIQRNVNTYDNAGETTNRALSLRVGFKF